MTKLKDLLVQVPGDEKRAGVESPDQQQLEQDFSGLAYAFLKDRATALLPYLLGFEVVDREEDGSRAIGLFGFKVGESFYYVPAFFLGNQIKGMDLLYAKEENQFVPLRENWINHIVDKQTIQLGTPAEENLDSKDFTSPNFQFLAEPPRGGTQGTAPKFAQVFHDICGAWNQMQATTVEMLEKDAEFQEAFANAIQAASGQRKFTKASSTLVDFLTNQGGPDAVNAVVGAMEDPRFAKAACAFYEPKDLMITKFAAELKPKEAAKKIEVITSVEEWDDNTRKHKKKLVRDGFSIDDNRSDDEKSEVIKDDYMQQISNPDIPGLYNVLLTGSADESCHVLQPGVGPWRTNAVLVVNPETNDYFTAESRRVYVNGMKIDNDETDLYSKGKSVSDLTPDEKYTLVNERGEATAPFRVKSVRTEDGSTVRISICWDDSLDYRAKSKYDYPLPIAECSYYENDPELVLTDGTGGIRSVDYCYIVPKEAWKAIKLEDYRDLSYDERKAKRSAFAPATYCEVVEAMQKSGVHRLMTETRDGGIAYSVRLNDVLDQDNMNYKQACVHLVAGYGMSVEDAEDILKEAQANFKSRCTIKLAQVMMPPIPPQTTGYDAQIDVPYEYNQEEVMRGNTVGVPEYQPTGPGSGINMGGEGARQSAGGSPVPGQGQPMDPASMQLAQDAAGAGQGQVFDHAMVGTLARTYDASTLVDSFVPQLMKSLDLVGRILFLFYWKNEEFAERYGDQDLTELEDHLRSVFKNYGDLILKLKQKTIDNQMPYL